ncbi:MAG: 4Fe-4S dicluster domain-containing protein [Nitrospiraceae bacterium]|nr:4Fe-4S dicluster domain-containing protein [Nitrospiraceae bacterium]
MFKTTVDLDKCIGDEECVNACPAEVFDFDEEAKHPIVARQEDCLGCETCVEVCTVGAITVEEV